MEIYYYSSQNYSLLYHTWYFTFFRLYKVPQKKIAIRLFNVSFFLVIQNKSEELKREKKKNNWIHSLLLNPFLHNFYTFVISGFRYLFLSFYIFHSFERVHSFYYFLNSFSLLNPNIIIVIISIFVYKDIPLPLESECASKSIIFGKILCTLSTYDLNGFLFSYFIMIF